MKAERDARALAENPAASNYDSGVVDHNTDASSAKAWFKEVGAAVKTKWVLCGLHIRFLISHARFWRRLSFS
jgi:hypothetical protein